MKPREGKSETDIQTSMRQVGRLYPVLRDAKGKLIDGFHRVEHDPRWESITLPDVKTQEDRLIVSAHANLSRRTLEVEEKKKLINDLAQIYWDQGLRKKHQTQTPGPNGFSSNKTENQITAKLIEVLDGAIGKSTILKYLNPEFKNQEHSEARKKEAKERQDRTPAYELIVGSFGTHISRSFGKGIFPRMKREMLQEAKDQLTRDPKFIKDLRAEIRGQLEAELAEELKILKGEWDLEKQNFFNLTNHYGDELKELDKAKRLETGNLNVSERANLRRAGIIIGHAREPEARKGGGVHPTSSRVSLGAKVILGLVPGVGE